jgi:transcriptional regulator with XRE-family HTH domain
MAEEIVTTRFKQKPRYFFREWRKFRDKTQEQIAEVVGVQPSAISQIENGKQGFTNSTLEGIAYALMCEPGDLLMRNPLDKNAPWSLWDKLPETDRRRVLVFMADLAKTAD